MFCNNCGAQLEDGIAVCTQCGNDLSAAVAAATAEAPEASSVAPVTAPVKKNNKNLLIIIIAAVAVALIVVGAIFIPKAIKDAKADELEESLVGETFTYTDWLTYSYMQFSYTFKEDNRVEKESIYSALDSTMNYEWDYEIDYVSEDEIILKVGSKIGDEFTVTDKFLVELNYDGDEIKSFVNVDAEEEVYK